MIYILKKFWTDITMFVLIATCIAYMHLCNGYIYLGPFWLCEFCTFILFDTAVLLFATTVISFGHKKIGYSLAFILTQFWALLNIFYYRFFNQYFNFRDFGEAQNLKDGIVWDSIFSVIQISDILLPCTIILFVFLIIKMRNHQTTRIERINLLATYSLLPFILIIIFGTERVLMDAILAIRDSEQKAKHLQGWDYSIRHKRNIHYRGLFCGQFYDDAIVKREDKVLTTEDDAFVRNYCKELSKDYNKQKKSTHNNRTSRNIIFILLESALSHPIGKTINGVEITPNLNALLNETGTYYNSMCRENIAIGQSFDGQFIYHTGLLPLVGKLTSTYVVDNNLKALPSFLKEKYGTMNTVMTIPTEPTMWRQVEMCRLYGYDMLLSTKDIGKGIGDKGNYEYLNDSLLVDLLINKRQEIFSKPPFLQTILTMSMHGPYDINKYDANMPTLSSYSLLMNNYLKHYHYTDRQLGRFFQFLKSNGIYENSIIIIASDHGIDEKFLEMPKEQINNKHLPFIIAHADINQKECWEGEMNQLDVFSTLLDLLNLETDWYGLGSSILDRENYKNRLNKTTQKVSDLIIESNFWK